MFPGIASKNLLRPQREQRMQTKSELPVHPAKLLGLVRHYVHFDLHARSTKRGAHRGARRSNSIKELHVDRVHCRKVPFRVSQVYIALHHIVQSTITAR